jgi:hypothetical protein
LLPPGACDVSVQNIADAGEQKHDERSDARIVDQQEYENRNEKDSKDRQLIGQRHQGPIPRSKM